MKIDAEVRSELEAIAERCGCELIHVDFRGGALRLVLDREGGVTIDECAEVSRESSAFLDVVDFGSGQYTLEATSPGLDREFYSEKDYERFRGSNVRMTWMDGDKKRSDVGRLRGFDSGASSVELELPDGRRTVALDQIVKTRLEPEL